MMTGGSKCCRQKDGSHGVSKIAMMAMASVNGKEANDIDGKG